MKPILLLALPLGLALARPAHAQTGDSTAAAAHDSALAAERHHAAHRNRNRIEQDEMRESHATTAYDVVRERRGNWLNRHSPTITESEPDLLVFRDDAEMGDVEELRQVAAAEVIWMEFLTPYEVQQRYHKSTHEGGIVLHTTVEHGAPVLH